MNTETINCTVVSETEKAVRLRDSNDDSRTAWFPKSHVSFTRRNIKSGEATAEVSEWVLREKGWME